MNQREYANYCTAQLNVWQTADSTQIENEKQRLLHEIDILKAKYAAMTKLRPFLPLQER